MDQLERSLELSANRYETASNEMKRLKEQIKKGITPQIEGLLEEDKLLKKLGSPQESDRGRILGGFLKNHEFGLGRGHALSLQKQIAKILIAAAAAQQRLDVPVNGFHDSQRQLRRQ